MEGRKRQVNFELLRIVAMLMIVSLHYLDKSDILMGFLGDQRENPVSAFGWLIEAFCNVAVNCYVLISGYFCVKSVWKPGRALALLSQVLFYSIGIPCVLFLCGSELVSGLGLYDWLDFVLPIETEHYWFATYYLFMYFFSPFLSIGIRQMEKRQLQTVMVFLLCFFSLGKTIIPANLEAVGFGYGMSWFLCLFVFGGYIRIYGISWLEKQSHAATVYFLSGLCVWLMAMLCNILRFTPLGGETETLGYYPLVLYSYNHLFCLVGAVALFYVFKNMRIREGRFAGVVRKLAPYTFGVYLLHEHNLVRYEWMNWLGVEAVRESFLFVPHMIGCILLVFVIGIAVDAVRAWLFVRAGAMIGSWSRKTS